MMCGICVAAVHHELVEPLVPLAHHAAAFHRRHALARGADCGVTVTAASCGHRKVVVDRDFEKDVVAPSLVHQRARPVPAPRSCRPPRAAPRKSTVDRSAMSSASARVAPTHIATSSPTWRTLPLASTGCSEDLNPCRPETARIGLTPARSAAVKRCASRPVGARDPPSDPAVRHGQRTNATSSMPAKPDVGDVLSAAAQKPVVFLALEARADAELRHRRTPTADRRVLSFIGHSPRLLVGRHIDTCVMVPIPGNRACRPISYRAEAMRSIRFRLISNRVALMSIAI